MARALSAIPVLWISNVFALIVVLGEVIFKVWSMFNGVVLEPEMSPMHLDPLPEYALPIDLGNRNPFDPSGMPWHEKEDEGRTGQVKGVIVLPGIKRVVTDEGVVKLGETITDGKVIDIEPREIKVEIPSGVRVIMLPSTRRPTLDDLNKAHMRH